MQDFSLARRIMVESQLRPQGVTDRNVLAAMGSVERERFVPDSAKALAYFDRPLKIGEGRTLMPPAALGRLLNDAAPKAGQRALVIGSGTGYSAAILRHMGLEVIAVEASETLAAFARDAGVETMVGDHAKGWPKSAPYDLVLLDGAVEEVPAVLASQLAPEGVLVGAILDQGVTRLIFGSGSNGMIGWRSIVDADVDPIPGFERPRAFTF